MNNAYRVRFTNWDQNPTNEYFFTNELDAQNYADKFKKYGYTPAIDTIYFQEVLEGAN